MRDCILAVVWPKAHIFNFFRDHGCTTADLVAIANFKADNLSRSRMVDLAFESLSARADSGLGQFRAMLQALLSWSHFDPYYFDTLKKLDRSAADRHLSHLRQLQEIRDEKIHQERRRQQEAETKRRVPSTTLSDVKDRFLTLFSQGARPQERGYALEGVLSDMSKLSGLETTEPYRVSGEQIDGAVKFDGEHYLVEAKWQDKMASNEPLYQFAMKVEGKMYGRGIFVSVNGFAPNTVRDLVVGKALRTVLVDGGDLTLVAEGLLTFSQIIDRKVKAAQTKGLIFVDPMTGCSKV